MKKPRKDTVWLGLVFPGMGQALQGRWLAAAAFGVPALACVIALLVAFFRMIVNGFKFFTNINDINQPEFPIQLLIELACAVTFIIIGSVIDASIAHSRACKQFNERGADEITVGPPALH